MNEALNQFVAALDDGDVARVREVWRKNPQLRGNDTEREFLSYYIRYALPSDDDAMLRTLVELGADVSYLPSESDRGFAWEALCENALCCFKYIVESNGQINFETPDGIRCFALERACRRGLLAEVKMLVEHGAVLDYRWTENSRLQGNPLSIAIRHGNDEVADYLRSIGSPESRQDAPRQADEPDALQTHLAAHFGAPDANEFQQVVSGDVPVSVAVARSDEEQVLVTRGMSAEPVTQNDGTQLYAELMMQLPVDWELSLEADGDKAT